MSSAACNPYIWIDTAKTRTKTIGAAAGLLEPTEYRFPEPPGRLNNLFSPTFLEPSLILEELEVNGSGAATLDSFWAGVYDLCCVNVDDMGYLFALFTDHGGSLADDTQTPTLDNSHGRLFVPQAWFLPAVCDDL